MRATIWKRSEQSWLTIISSRSWTMAFSMQIPIREIVHISDGKIVWIDMGMMGRLSDRDRELISDAIRGYCDQ